MKTANQAGVDIRYLGIAPLFDEPRAYAGPQNDWIIRRADPSDGIVPAAQQDRLQQLVHVGLDFPRVYVAHEIPKDRLALTTGTNDPPVTLGQAAVRVRKRRAYRAEGDIAMNHPGGLARHPRQAVTQAQVPQQTGGVGREGDGRADLAQLGGLFRVTEVEARLLPHTATCVGLREP